MGLIVRRFQAIRSQVRVNLGRVDACVTEQFLNAANIRTPIDKMSRKCMSQCVRTRAGIESSKIEILFQHSSDASHAEPCAVLVEK